MSLPPFRATRLEIEGDAGALQGHAAAKATPRSLLAPLVLPAQRMPHQTLARYQQKPSSSSTQPPRPPRQPPRTTPNPYALFAIAAVSFGSFIYVTQKRDREAKLIPESERRRYFESPLIPPIQREEPK